MNKFWSTVEACGFGVAITYWSRLLYTPAALPARPLVKRGPAHKWVRSMWV